MKRQFSWVHFSMNWLDLKQYVHHDTAALSFGSFAPNMFQIAQKCMLRKTPVATLYQTFNVKAEKRHTLSSFASRHSMSCSAFSRDNLKYKEIFCCKDIIKLLSWTCKCLDILYLMHFCCRFQQTILTIIIKLHIIHLYVMSQFPLFSAI